MASTALDLGAVKMVDIAILWGLHNPLQCVAGLAALSILVGLLLVPRLHDISDHGHPRC